MISISKLPALKLLALILAGIFSGYLIESATAILVLSILMLIAGIAFLILKRGLFTYIFLGLAIGLLLSFKSVSDKLPLPDKITGPQYALISGKVDRILKEGDGYSRYLITDAKIDTRLLPSFKGQTILLTCFCESALAPGTAIFADARVRFARKPNLPGEFNEQLYLSSFNSQWVAVCKPNDLAVTGSPGTFENIVYSIRKIIKKINNEYYDENLAAIFTAMTSGDRSDIDPGIYELFQNSGTAHFLAISGLHIGIIALLIHILTIYIPGRVPAFIAFLLALAIVVSLTGMQPSALRAAIMIALYKFSLLLERKPHPLNIVALAAVIMLLGDPNVMFSAGFQLSFAAVGGIAVFYELISNRISRLNKYIPAPVVNLLALNLAVSIIAVPLAALYFGIVSFVSPIVNLAAVPLFSMALIFSLPALVFSFIPAIGKLFALSAEFLLKLGIEINSLFIHVENSFYRGDEAFLLSMIISALILIFIYSKSIKAFVIRLGYTAALFILFINLSDKPEGEIKIFPREQFTAIEIKDGYDRTVFLISDRRPSLYPLRDVGMEEYIKNQPGKLLLGINGNTGINLADKIKNERKISTFEIPLDMLIRLKDILGTEDHLPQLIDNK
ncbi:MAG: ComEC/Rec2 family competence protein [Candidatus Kapaibacterium sp.]